ncbi:SDR family NAD(P)-dependent oxidoreductase [Lysinibacillus piscis]|uniref:SDR family NAD(P)-dependent oxidoreductase n=1 Tax=Lysinibacillus piscis TaxID=2518931 RepID=UPI00285256AB|nr:SDR family oxidoreductase [Lysinibacillus sp. KH24]
MLVIGGAAGIGKQIAEDFAQDGHQTIVADIQPLNDSLMHHCFVDTSSWDSVHEMASYVLQTFGKIDVLVYSAGITKRVALEETSWELWQKTMAINLHGLFYSIRAIAPAMMKQRSGSIVIIGSGSAITGSGGGIQYYTSKGGAFGLMRSLVKELGEHGITINVIAPRVIESQMLDSLYPTEEAKQVVIDQIPIGRTGTPMDISELTRFLASEQATYIHGQILLLDGGRTYWNSPD